MSPVWTMSKEENLLNFGNSLVFLFFKFFFKTSDCCYGYCDQHYDWWIWPKGLSTIGCFNCPITGVQLKPIVR